MAPESMLGFNVSNIPWQWIPGFWSRRFVGKAKACS